MKYIFCVLSVVVLLKTTTAQTLTLRSDSTLTQLDERLIVRKNLFIPHGVSPSLNGGLNELGGIYYNTSDSLLYVYAGNSTWRQRTIEENVKDLERFIRWTEENGLTGIERITYNELLKYVQYLKSQSLSLHTVNVRLNSLRKYYDHLKEEGTIDKNPARLC